MSNAAAKNEVISFQRAADGKLNDPDRYETGGRGSGGLTDPLESQGSLTLSQDHSFLFAVNAGSGSVSVFRVRGAHLFLIDRTPSGGSQPVAVAQWKNLVYVLNSGGSGSVVGFRFNEDGHLTLIPNSTTFLSANATGGASITISPDGQFLAVTERLANLIDIFRITADGTLTPLVENPSPVPGTFSASVCSRRKPHCFGNRTCWRNQWLYDFLVLGYSQRQSFGHQPGRAYIWRGELLERRSLQMVNGFMFRMRDRQTFRDLQSPQTVP